jgi:hypothetical protein
MSPYGFYMGGASFWGGSVLPARSGNGGSGTPVTVPVIGTPEPGTAGLLLLSGFMLLLYAFKPGISGKKPSLSDKS